MTHADLDRLEALRDAEKTGEWTEQEAFDVAWDEAFPALIALARKGLEFDEAKHAMERTIDFGRFMQGGAFADCKNGITDWLKKHGVTNAY